MKIVILLIYTLSILIYVDSLRYSCTKPSFIRIKRLGMAHADKESTAGKGFGKTKPSQKKKASKREIKEINMNFTSGDPKINAIDSQILDPKTKLKPYPEAPVNIDEAIESSTLFKSKRARQEALLDEKIAKLKEEEDLLASDPSVGAVPELVADRMIGRIAAFFGIPVFSGLAIFVGAFFYSKQTDTVIQPNIVAYATQVPFVLGLVGITYGILSASWEPDSDGSMLGINEFKTNVGRIKDGLKRTRETAELKDEIEKEMKRTGRRK